jgi:hypothetical protein
MKPRSIAPACDLNARSMPIPADQCTKARTEYSTEIGCQYCFLNAAPATHCAATLANGQRRDSLGDQVDDLRFALHDRLDLQHPPALEMLAVAQDQACDSNHNNAELKP